MSVIRERLQIRYLWSRAHRENELPQVSVPVTKLYNQAHIELFYYLKRGRKIWYGWERQSGYILCQQVIVLTTKLLLCIGFELN
jgi:hypothetical protein